MVLKGAEKVKEFGGIGGRIHPPSLYELPSSPIRHAQGYAARTWRAKEDTRLRRGFGAARESEFRRRETEVSMAVAGYSILDAAQTQKRKRQNGKSYGVRP
jgi:hypothetical protein